MKRRVQTFFAPPRAFTMIELLVAMAVMAILVVMLFGIVDVSAKLWKDNENRVDAYREARAALNTISADIANLVTSTNTNFFSTNAIGDIPPDMVTNGTIFFLTALPPTAQAGSDKGEICTVGYYRRFSKQTTISASALSYTGFHLYRTLYSSDQTYSNLIVTNPNPLDDLAQPTNSTAAEILARNILALDFRYYETNVTPGQWKLWTKSVANPLPQMIEIRLTAVSDDQAKRLSGSNDWVTNNPALTNSLRTFVSRVQVPRLPATN